jgi:hypothetical protein
VRRGKVGGKEGRDKGGKRGSVKSGEKEKE